MNEQSEIQIEDNRTQEEVFQDIFWRLGYIQGKLEAMTDNLDNANRIASKLTLTTPDKSP